MSQMSLSLECSLSGRDDRADRGQASNLAERHKDSLMPSSSQAGSVPGTGGVLRDLQRWENSEHDTDWTNSILPRTGIMVGEDCYLSADSSDLGYGPWATGCDYDIPLPRPKLVTFRV